LAHAAALRRRHLWDEMDVNDRYFFPLLEYLKTTV
jgi:hypothetical protein